MSTKLLHGLPKPDLYVALSAPPGVLVSRVSDRGRSQDVPPSEEYLRAVSVQREDFLQTTETPVLHIDSNLVDFRTKSGQFGVRDAVAAALWGPGT